MQHAQAGGGRGILATIHNLWRTEGVRRGFFKGMLYPIVSNGAINSIFFGVYGSLLPKLQVLHMKILHKDPFREVIKKASTTSVSFWPALSEVLSSSGLPAL